MAIGTGAALLGSAVLGIGGSIIGGNAQKKAAKQAADTSLQVANQNNALARYVYDQNRGVLDPYVQRGNAAGGVLNQMLGLSAANTNSAATMPISALGGYPSYGGSQPSALGPYASSYPTSPPQDWQPAYPGELHYTQEPAYRASLNMPVFYDEGNYPGAYGAPGSGYVTAPAPAPQGALSAAANPGDPFRQYIANSDYAFQFTQGANKLNSGYAANGALNSGAAMKAMEKYRQDLQSGYRNEYIGYLGQQQGVGLSGASALAGVGQNYVGNVTANNTNAGNNAANAALARGSINSQMWTGIGGALGNLAGSYGMGWWGGGGALSKKDPKYGW